jgi:hypothetical protein
MILVKEVSLDELDFSISSSQQFATVLFDREQDSNSTLITVLKDGKIKQFDGDNNYNPSLRRHSSCVYVKEECSEKTIKICTVQHKGTTLVQVFKVSEKELAFLFDEE